MAQTLAECVRRAARGARIIASSIARRLRRGENDDPYPLPGEDFGYWTRTAGERKRQGRRIKRMMRQQRLDLAFQDVLDFSRCVARDVLSLLRRLL
ncbi:hypothetical protein [Caballeronia sp. GAFFF2]|uniref:hypothetical protein n=1 Tax=Caballeronia sp. GAFFF2 TaxID=2921741 RepID=UPI002027E6EB|nr:hypothetical protein [Caballeronia sp. GAFFF2]